MKNMAYNKYSFAVRAILTIILLIGAYSETGPWIACCLFLAFAGIEMIGFLVTNNLKNKSVKMEILMNLCEKLTDLEIEVKNIQNQINDKEMYDMEQKERI